MKEQRFGIEIEFTGITRERAAEVVAQTLGSPHSSGTSVVDATGRRWKLVYDGSVTTQRKENGRIVDIDDNDYSVELVSPICTWDDIPVVQQIVRNVRKAGAFANDKCGIHIHVDGSPFDAATLRNLTNIMYAKEDLIYKALGVEVEREHQYCKKTDQRFLDELNRRKPHSLDAVSRVWYDGDPRTGHYDNSRYHCLNLHSLFTKGTVEFRLFNSDIHHAGKIKAYIQFCLAVTGQALNQRSASIRKTQSSNEKYTFRTWLLRLGMIGDEFKTARTHLLEKLDGCIAWKDPAQAEQQKERLRQKREAKREAEQDMAPQAMDTPEALEEPAADDQEQGPVLAM